MNFDRFKQVTHLYQTLDTQPPDALSASFLVPIEDDLHGAFSARARGKIRERADYKCELTGWSHVPREAAHFNHDKQSPDYDNPDNGLLVSDIAHLAHHVMHKGRAAQIGLTEFENNWAIDSIARRVINFRRDRQWKGLTEEQIDEQLRVSVLSFVGIWRKYFSEA